MNNYTLSTEQIDILKHTKRTGRYVTDSNEDMVLLTERGFLKDYGPQDLAGGMHYYTITSAGSKAIV